MDTSAGATCAPASSRPFGRAIRSGQPAYRFNWNTPFILSSHNSQIFYCGGNYVFPLRQARATICRRFRRKSRGPSAARPPRWPSRRATPNVLYAGTDDGYLWVTRDGGSEWTNVADKVGLPGPRWVASIEPSRFADGRAYVAFDAPSLRRRCALCVRHGGLSARRGSRCAAICRWARRACCARTSKTPNVLYLGTEFGVWVSIDRGGAWTKINNNLPTVAVHEFAQHPTTGEMVAATHGRSLWILDVTPLRQMKANMLKAEATLYRPATAMRWRREPTRGTPYGVGNHRFVGQNPPAGAQIYYSLTKKADKVQLKIVDYAGQTVRELPAKGRRGIASRLLGSGARGARSRTRTESAARTRTKPGTGRHVSRRPDGGRQGTHAGTAR